MEATVQQTDLRKVIRVPLHINNPEFAEALAGHLREITKI
ncbi:MAG: hypothetical protein FWH52_07530 [Synergistaceae bacterium]|nr:hypothetical protein [Synergistaceae bacterium]